MTASTGPEASRAMGYRPDLEGLRAVAVLLILLFHAGVPGLAGGYVGVDVFFVISGFLITGLLAHELRERGTIDWRAFYARRIRRILPASFVVLGVTLVASVVILSPIGFWKITPDIAAAAAYVPNLLFARRTVDYFHPAQESPVIHYWSLGVEEQFYIVWPAFLLLAWRFLRGSESRLTLLVAVAVVGSIVLGVVGTELAPTASFYLLPTRAWELGAGALLALERHRLRALGSSAANLAGVAGLALIAVSAVAFTDATPFPGIAALVPVLGTVLVIAAGGATAVDGASAAARAGARAPWTVTALSWAPMRYVGRISYSLYLWHWPLLMFTPIALGAAVPGAIAAGIAVALSVALAAITYRWVEDPMRHGRYLGRRPSRNAAAALLASVVIVALSLGGGYLAVDRFRAASVAPIVQPESDPFVGLIPAAGPTLDGPVPADLVPGLLNLFRANVSVQPVDLGCSLESGETVNDECTFGAASASTKVVLLGDSHLGQWWPAIERLAASRGWRVVYLIKSSCTYADVRTASDSGGLKRECDTWRARAMERIAAEQPDLVLLSANHRALPWDDGRVLTGSEAWAAMRAGAERTISALQAMGASVAVLADTPALPFDPAECLSANADHVIRCAVPRDEALDAEWLVAEREAAEAQGATFIDVVAWACPSDPCPMILGRYAVFADTNHLARTFVQALVPRLDAAIPR